MKARCVGALLAATVLAAAIAPNVAAPLDRPRYTRGDTWTYATDLAETFGLSLRGNTTLTAGAVVPLVVQGTAYEALEVSVTGGGVFAGDIPPFGRIVGTWSLTGVDHWETGSWRSVRSFLRMTADGSLPGPTPIPFRFEVVNETTRRVTSDTFPWPIPDGGSGDTNAHWNVSLNVTFQAEGSPPGWNQTWIDGDFVTHHAHLGAERIIVPAGSFDTARIDEIGPEGGRRERWFSERAGADVRQYEYNETGGRTASTELTRFHYAAGVPPSGFPWVFVGFAGLVAAVAILGFAAWRRRKPPEVWMPPDRENGDGSP